DCRMEHCGGTPVSCRIAVGGLLVCQKGLDKPRRIFSLPPRLVAALVSLARLLPRWRGVNTQMVSRQNTDLVFDDSVLKECLEYQPRPFRPSAEDFEIPSELEQYRLPR
ncbi:MAG: hypothetical protein ACE1Y4_19030, partial [Lysobacterales bacterium]